MPHEESAQMITYPCTYCGHSITSKYDPYQFSDVCPVCHGSVRIPRDLPARAAAANIAAETPAAPVVEGTYHISEPAVPAVASAPSADSATEPAVQPEPAQEAGKNAQGEPLQDVIASTDLSAAMPHENMYETRVINHNALAAAVLDIKTTHDALSAEPQSTEAHTSATDLASTDATVAKPPPAASDTLPPPLQGDASESAEVHLPPASEVAAPALQHADQNQVAAMAVPSMQESHDPSAIPPVVTPNETPAPRPETRELNLATQYSPPTDRPFNRPAVCPKPTRFWLIAATLVIVAGAGWFVVDSIQKGRERAQIETDVAMLVQQADESFKAKDIGAASAKAREAQEKIDNSPLKLSQEKVTAWESRLALFKAIEKKANSYDAYMSTADLDTKALRSRLESERAALEREKNPDNVPLLTKIDTLLTVVTDKETRQKEARLLADLKTADDLYKSKNIEESANTARKILNAMKLEPVVNNPDISKRAETLVERAIKFAEVRRIRLAASDDKLADAKKKIQAEIDKLDPKDADKKPLIESMIAFKQEIQTAEAARDERLQKEKVEKDRLAKKLDPNDAKFLSIMLKDLQRMDDKYTPGKSSGDGVKFTYDGKEYKLGLNRTLLAVQLFVECGDNRIILDSAHFLPPKKGDPPVRPIRVMLHAIALGDAMKKAGVKSGDYWDAKEEAPLVSARRVDGKGNEYIFLGDRLYTGKANEKTDKQKQMDEDFKKDAEMLAVAVENDAPTSQELRDVVAMAVRYTGIKADFNDHLPGEYVRKVIDEGYIESNMPGTAERLKKELAQFRAAYKLISEPFENFKGTSADGEASEFRTYEDHAVWRLYDKKTDMTTFAIKNPDDERDCLFILYDYAGKIADLPPDKAPLKVRMTHQAVGVIAEYDPSTGKMTHDPAKWELSASLESYALPEDYRASKGYGTPTWMLPPHVLLVDKLGNTLGIVTPYGRLDSQNFMKIADPKKRQEAMDAFLDQMVKVMPDKPEGSYLHLYYRYMFQYIYDSPLTDHPELLGSRARSGDIHQTTYQSLCRFMGGRYVGDCDDLAEVFMTVTRKMGKLSYVMSLPAHAACGWAEKDPNSSEYTFCILDTGPPRKFHNNDLDKIVEMANRAYDEEGTMRFDPKSLGFLFRFNGEPTRTPYYLSSRMYIDPAYGEAMEKVQSYWHFHFYALGIQTMLDMIEKKGDRVPENCNEVAGLYGQVREVEKSIHWSEESIKQMKNDEALSRMGEEYRIASMWRGERENEKAWDAIKKTVAELNKLHESDDSFKYLGMRMEVMALLITLDKPWEAWEMVRPDIEVIGSYNPQKDKWQAMDRLKLEHIGSLTTAYLKMKDLMENRKQLTPAENKQRQSLEKLLAGFYGNGKALFEEEDDFNEFMRKYAYLGVYYAAKFGRKVYLEELLKDGPYPDPAKKRDHFNRSNPLPEDWNWIRLSLASYSIGIADAIDLDDPPEKWRKEEAVKLCDQMVKASVYTAKFGSLAHEEFSLLSTRALRAFVIKDWKDLEDVIKDTGKRDWARLTTDIAETFGHGARFCTPEEFAEQYRMFTKYIKSKPAYFTVVYEAYRADGFKHAVLASKIALERNPDDEDMKREAKYLEELANDRIKLEAEKK